MFPCNVCSKNFQFKNNMYRHRRSSHEEYRTQEEFECDHCGLKEKNKEVFIKHVKEHNVKPRKKPIPGSRLKCPKCDCCVKNYLALDEHLAQIHSISISEEYLEFPNEGEFFNWKLGIEKKTQSQYISIRAIRKRKSYSQREYMCHRSYRKKLNPTKNKKHSKSLGTNKIGCACPSRMIVKFTAKKVIVNFTPIHVGHLNEVIRMRLPSHERATIAGKLRDGVTIQRVLDDIRDDGMNNGENFRRIHYIQKSDVYNIIRDNNINYITRLHKDDVVSVELLVTTLQKQEDCPILHYVSDNENFCLIIMTPYQKCMLMEHQSKICVDGTHGLNSYGYQLVSIVVIDEFNNGIPAAFCFTKKTDLAAITLFYSKVKEAIGSEYNIKAQVFMSDDAPQFYDAWVSVFGRVDHKLLCWWHISKNWVKNLNSKIEDKARRKIVKDTLYTLATDITTPEEFESRLAKFLEDLLSDPLTLPFYNYFMSYYVLKKSSWAFCYRKHLGLNTNMHLESLHKKIKHTYLDGKQCPRLDKAINTLFKLIRDSMYDRIIKLAKNCPSDKIRKIKAAHKKSSEISDEDIKCEEQGKKWRVKSQKNPEFDYEVERFSEACECCLRCAACEICVHSYQCSCVDNVIYLNICKHIHKIAENNKIDGAKESGDCAVQVYKTMALLESHPILTSNENDGKDVLSDEVRTKIQLLLQFTDSFSEDELKYISQKLDEIIHRVKFNKKKAKTDLNSRETNPNCRITPQRAQVWPQKKKKRIPLMEIPSNSARKSCLNYFVGKEALHVHDINGNDHVYGSKNQKTCEKKKVQDIENEHALENLEIENEPATTARDEEIEVSYIYS